MADPQPPAACLHGVSLEEGCAKCAESYGSSRVVGEQRVQHPDIPALVERVYRECPDPCKVRNVESGCTCAAVEAALRTLARPVEDEEDEAWQARDNLLAIAENEEPEVAEPLKHAASLLARLARQTARAEQEAARLQGYARYAKHMVDCRASATRPCTCGLVEFERALAAAVGAEEPRLSAPTPEDVARELLRNTRAFSPCDYVAGFCDEGELCMLCNGNAPTCLQISAIAAALRAARAAAIEEAIPPGYVVVPKEPTEAMIEAVAPFPEHLAEEHRDDPEWRTQMTAATVADQMVARQTYRDMIAKAIRALGEESAAPREEESAG